jgi:four helix bundle protein
MENKQRIRCHTDLDVYKLAYGATCKVYEYSKQFPKEEQYSLTDQIRRSSRSVCANIAEAFRKRKYPKSFISKLSDAEGEAAETQVWIQFAVRCNYLKREYAEKLYNEYDNIIGKIVNMQLKADSWGF